MILEIEDPEKKMTDIEYPHFKTKSVFLIHMLVLCSTFGVL